GVIEIAVPRRRHALARRAHDRRTSHRIDSRRSDGAAAERRRGSVHPELLQLPDIDGNLQIRGLRCARPKGEEAENVNYFLSRAIAPRQTTPGCWVSKQKMPAQ